MQRGGASRVLVVNDHADQLEMVKRLLGQSGFSVVTATDGREGLEAARRERPDLIISDVVMPNMDGIEMCRRIREQPELRTTPVLLVSAHRKDSASVVEGLRNGADDYLEVPYDPVHLIAKAVQLIERRWAEASLRASEAEMRALFAAMTDVVIVLDAEGRYLKIAPTDPAYLFKPPAELVGRTLHEIFPQEQADFFFAHVRRALSEGHMHRVEYSLRFAEKEVWFDGSVSPMSDNEVLWIARDITERKRAEEALKESEERYRLLFESNPQPMWVFDLETFAFLAINEAAVNHYGYSRDEFLAMTVKDIRPPEEVPGLMEYLAKPAAGLDRAGAWRHRKKDGRVIDVEITAHRLTFAGRPAELVLVNDVTERLTAEAALREAEEKYRSIFENAVEGIFQATAEGRLISANPALAHMLGYDSPRELIASITDIEQQLYVESAPRCEGIVKLLEVGGVVRGFKIQLRRKDGNTIWVSASTRAVRDAGGTLLYYEGSVEDISEHKQLEEQLRHSQKMEAVGRLAGGVSHDFNNLLTAIIGYSDLMMMLLKEEDPLRHYVEEIRTAGDRAASLTRQLLAFSRKQVLQPRLLDINSLVTNVGKMLRRLVGEDIGFITLLRPEAGLINADPGQIEQVLVNLVVNARDAMPEGGKIVIETASAELDKAYADLHVGVEPGDYVMLAVSDTGTGMDEKTQARIFEPFFTTKPTGKGTGLGLSTVYGIVRQSGGNIWVYSEVGRGTTFKVYLPRVTEDAPEDESVSKPEPPLRGTETVLLAEDEEVVRRLAREVLEGYGYRVLEAGNGGAAFSACVGHDGPIHLLITDVVMPGMGGRDLANRLSRLRPEMKVLFMSGYTDDAIVHHGVLEAGIPFIQKPFSPDDLARKVREVLDGV
ncbi:MAG TPA: PAS domain S-box protein [Blastocatellia bacterium]|nr:PAS domain S-box protein [Blastocatellia bacterium]